MSIHAPTEESNEEEKDKFYDTLQKNMKEYKEMI